MADPAPNAAPPPGDPVADDELRLRARALGVLGGSAWHEAAQPLNGLRGFASLLRTDGVTAEQLGVDPALILEAVTTLERLGRAITDLARGNDRRVPLRDLVDELLAVAGSLTMDVEVTAEIPDDLPEPAVHAGVLRVAVASLLVDALTALGGPRRARGSLTVRATRGGEAVTLVLEDDGYPGTPSSLLELTRLLGAHGTAVRHDAGPDAGNRVTLVLPLRAGVPVTLAPRTRDEDPGAADPRPTELTVLVCDDDEVIRGLILRTLTRQGVKAVAAASGAEAAALVDQGGIDVILCDDRMPGMTGRALHGAVAASRPGLARRFVLMSGDSGDEEVAAYVREADIAVLGKPFDLAGLATILREAAAR